MIIQRTKNDINFLLRALKCRPDFQTCKLGIQCDVSNSPKQKYAMYIRKNGQAGIG